MILGAYYRDDRVLLALGLEARAPFPKGYTLEQGDWSLLDAVRHRAPFWRDDRRRRPGSAEMAGNEKVDVLIIGSGASGAAVAWSLADTRMRILCLEQGDWMKSTDFPSNGRDWEARRYTDFDISPNRRGRDTDYPVNDDNSMMKVANFNGVGGGTVIYTAHWPRMHPSDFKVKSLDGVADDWPIDYWALERFYDENDRMMGVSGLAGDPGVPPRHPPMPPIPLGKTGTHYAQAMNRLGWHWWPSDTTIATTDYDGRAPCINLGHCTPGCAQGAKASTDITYWPLAIRAGVELRTRCRVREITTDEHGMAAGAIYYDADGREHFQPAEVVILACNGVGTPRLLLNSASARFPDGLANSSGLVGKNLMLHPWPMVSGYVEEALDGGRAPITSMWSKQFYETDPVARLRARLHAAVQPRHRPGQRGDHQRRDRPPAVGPRPSSRLPRAARPSGGDRRRLRGPARGAQPRHARSRAEGQQRHPGAADRLHDQREHAPHDGARHRPRRGDPDRRRRHPDPCVAHRAELARATCWARRAWAPIRSARW